jgi:hypothetical protein
MEHSLSCKADNQGEKNTKHAALLAACFMQIFCLDYSSTLKMESIYVSETSVDFNQRYVSEYRTLH